VGAHLFRLIPLPNSPKNFGSGKTSSGVSFYLCHRKKSVKFRLFRHEHLRFFPLLHMSEPDKSYIITTRLQTKNGGEVVSIVIRRFDDEFHRQRDLRELREFAIEVGAELKVDELPRFSSESQ